MTVRDDDDIDEVAVERRCNGDRSVPLNRAEAAAAFAHLEARGYNAAEIGERLGVAARTVVHWRSGVQPNTLRARAS